MMRLAKVLYRVKRIPMLKERREHSVREPWSWLD
jgi:hypothetical protein